LISINFSTVYRAFNISAQAGRINDAKTVIRELWGASEVDSAIEEFLSVCKNDGSDSDSRWSEFLEEPHSRGCVKVVWMLLLDSSQHSMLGNYSLPYPSGLID